MHIFRDKIKFAPEKRAVLTGLTFEEIESERELKMEDAIAGF